MRILNASVCTIGLAAAMHLDWHAARPLIHDHSLGLSYHWLLAVPVLALIAWCVHRGWPSRTLAASVGIIGIASLLAAVIEPGLELLVEGAPWDWAFGRMRLVAFGTFLATGIVTYVVVLALLRRRAGSAGKVNGGEDR